MKKLNYLIKKLQYLFWTVLVIGLTSCKSIENVVQAAFKPPSIAYQSFSLGKISNESIEFNPVFKVTNNNGYAIPVDHFNYQLSFNESVLIKGKSSAIGQLPAKASKVVSLQIPLNRQTFKVFKEILANNKKINYQIKGDVQVMGFSIPFQQTNTFYRPSINIGHPQIEYASFEMIKMTLNLNINNQNDFNIPLTGFNYSVSSGGKTLFSGKTSSNIISRGANQISIPVTIHPKRLFSNILMLLRNPKLPLEITIDSPMISTKKNIRLDLSSILN